ncbi:MAG: amidohydrolase, partial [Pseudomonadota bacterium]
MPVINRIADIHPEATAWRQDLHRHPELLFDVHRTAAVVTEKLKEFGVDEVATGIGRTGVVGVIKGRQAGSGKVIGLRADMDALPIQEVRDLPYKSETQGLMHACGHDGHTAMLLAAAKYLAETRNFDGTAVVIFQPAEEGGGGGDEMVKDGMMERWNIQEVYGMHNAPNVPVGAFAFRSGPILAAADKFEVTITGLGGHAARPHECNDPMIVAAQLILGFQSIVSRNTDPLASLVISATQIQGSDAHNVIPE